MSNTIAVQLIFEGLHVGDLRISEDVWPCINYIDYLEVTADHREMANAREFMIAHGIIVFHRAANMLRARADSLARSTPAGWSTIEA